MSVVVLEFESFVISWQKTSVAELHDLKGVSPSIEGFLKKQNRSEKCFKLFHDAKCVDAIYPVLAKFVIIFTIRIIKS